MPVEFIISHVTMCDMFHFCGLQSSFQLYRFVCAWVGCLRRCWVVSTVGEHGYDHYLSTILNHAESWVSTCTKVRVTTSHINRLILPCSAMALFKHGLMLFPSLTGASAPHGWGGGPTNGAIVKNMFKKWPDRVYLYSYLKCSQFTPRIYLTKV